jgi:hypothetical protein
MNNIFSDSFYNFFSGHNFYYWIVISILVFIIISYLLKPSGKYKKGK